jgi:hypothetical protein
MDKEWGWNGPLPKDTRLARYYAHILLNTNHSIDFPSDVPKILRFKLQDDIPENNQDFVVLSIKY